MAVIAEGLRLADLQTCRLGDLEKRPKREQTALANLRVFRLRHHFRGGVRPQPFSPAADATHSAPDSGPARHPRHVCDWLT